MKYVMAPMRFASFFSVGFTPPDCGTRLEGLLLAYFFPREGLPLQGQRHDRVQHV